MNQSKDTTDRLTCLEERILYLEEANRHYVAILDMLASSSDFQADLNRDKSTEGIFRATLTQIARLFSFEAMGLLENREDKSFVLTVCEPSSCRDELSVDIDMAIMDGIFAWALNRNQSVTAPTASGSHTLLFRVIETRTCIRGMFIGRLRGNLAHIDAPSLNALSNVLLTTAYAMESSTLYDLLEGNLHNLGQKVQERTAELLAARDMAEASARELKAANKKLCREIVERKRAEDELLKTQKLESLGVFAGGIAHDFNNIFTAILGNLSFARMQISPSDKIAKRLEECEKATMRASELTRHLLTFARGGEPAKKLINTTLLIKEATSLVLLGSNVVSAIDLADDLWCVKADAGQLSQALHNLLINARQAMCENGEVTVRGANETMAPDNPQRLPPGAYVKIIVEDDGCGIPQENLGRIFDPYFTTKSQGSGLGLASVYSIVKRHGGTIEVSSTVRVGSSFTIYLPASPDRIPEAAVVKKVAESVSGGRVLIMDDEEIIREIVAEILQYLGYYVESCSDGREAVDRFRKARESNTPFSVVILDLTVPGGMGGKEAAPLILEVDPDAVLIVSSGYSNDPVIANYRHYGFRGVISKPFNTGTLAGELGRLIDKKAECR
jgi:signal transduction histidine kinase/ActR/RegA family two-component response regulator